MFLQDDSFNSRAPTLRRRSPTMFKAESLADGVNAGDENFPAAPFEVDAVDGDVLADGGGVSSHDSRDSTSSASLFESAKIFIYKNVFRAKLSNRINSALIWV